MQLDMLGFIRDVIYCVISDAKMVPRKDAYH